MRLNLPALRCGIWNHRRKHRQAWLHRKGFCPWPVVLIPELVYSYGAPEISLLICVTSCTDTGCCLSFQDLKSYCCKPVPDSTVCLQFAGLAAFAIVANKLPQLNAEIVALFTQKTVVYISIFQVC